MTDSVTSNQRIEPEVWKLRAEIERLRARLHRIADGPPGLMPPDAEARWARDQAELALKGSAVETTDEHKSEAPDLYTSEALDAARYRWLREQEHVEIASAWFLPTSEPVASGAELDAAIDRARGAVEKLESPEERHSRKVQFDRYYAMQSALVKIQQWDCLNPPRADLLSDLPWLRKLVDDALGAGHDGITAIYWGSDV